MERRSDPRNFRFGCEPPCFGKRVDGGRWIAAHQCIGSRANFKIQYSKKRSVRRSPVIIQPIVEGPGEVSAVPLLLRRLCHEAQAWNVTIAKPHRRPRSQFVNQDTFQNAICLAGRASGRLGILVLFDADDDCPAEMAPRLERWAHDAASGRPCSVVMANREYEAWFLASIESLRGREGSVRMPCRFANRKVRETPRAG